MQERIQKIIARAGVASRRHAEEMILAGQVAVNGKVVTELGSKADPEQDHIRVGGKLLRESQRKVYVVLNKPDGVVSTMSDPQGRRTIADFLRGLSGRVFPAGRLEYHASGLVLLTNDGELANRVMRAHRLSQAYLCKTAGNPNEAEIREIERRSSAKMRRARSMPAGWWEVTTTGASRNPFRSLLIVVGHPVDKMKRVSLGSVELGPLASGEYRHLTRDEVDHLRRALGRAERGLAPKLSSETEPRRRHKPSRRLREGKRDARRSKRFARHG